LSNLPPNWVEVKLGDVVEHFKDRIPDRSKWTFDRYIGGEHFDEGAIRVTKSNPIEGNEEIIGSAFHMRFKPGDVLYVTRNPRLRKGGIVDFEGVCSNVTFTLRAKEDRLLQSLLPFIIQTENFVMHTTNNAHGSTNPFLNWKDIAKYKLLLPPINEQKKISDILWSIEETQIKLEKLIEVTEKFKKELLEKLLTKGIGHKKFKQTELAEIPEEWDVKKVEEVLSFEYGQGLPEKKRAGGEFPVIGSSGIVGYHDSYIVESPVIIVGRKGASGEVILCNNNCWPIDTTYFIKLQNCMELLFSYYLLKSLNLAELSQKGAVPGLNRNDVYEILVPIAPKQEQKQISTMINKFDNLKINFEKHLEKIKNIKKKLTNEFLSGKLLIPVEVKS
jgi:type I restriction enzyme, S subunit